MRRSALKSFTTATIRESQPSCDFVPAPRVRFVGTEKTLPALLLALTIALLPEPSAMAQGTPGSIDSLEYQKPKTGMVQQYEEGRKRKADWHRQQKDPLPLLVWEILSGDDTGSYIVGRLNKHSSDFDSPVVSNQAESEESQKVINNCVESIVARYYEFLPAISSSGSSGMTSKLDEVLMFYLQYGKEPDFQDAISRFHDAAGRTKSPIRYEWHRLANGGDAETYVLVLPHDSWPDFSKSPLESFREILKKAFGQEESDSTMQRIGSSVQNVKSEMIHFRPELSYVPSPGGR